MARTVNCFAAWYQINIMLLTNRQLCLLLLLLDEFVGMTPHFLVFMWF
jgi:hypothetical protein